MLDIFNKIILTLRITANLTVNQKNYTVLGPGAQRTAQLSSRYSL